MIYTASLDTLAKIITGGILALCVAFYIFFNGTSGFWLWFGFLLFVFGLSFILRPVHYELHPDQIIVHRLIKPILVKRSEVTEVGLLADADKKGMLRTFGSGGFLGYFGKFWSKRLGHFTMYATRRDHLVLIQKNDGQKIVLSPDDENFIHDLRRQWRLG